MENVIAKKSVNALIAEGEIGSAAKFLLDKTGGEVTGVVLEAAKKMMGGLWVGGTAMIQEKSLVFRPNWLNRLIHKAEYTVTIPFEEMTGIDVRFGMGTNIIDIVTGDGKLSIRCFGAQAFAELIQKQKAVATST